MRIGLFDSGIGGLNVLSELLKKYSLKIRATLPKYLSILSA